MALRNALNLDRYLDIAEPATWIEVAHATIGMMLLRRLFVLQRGPQYPIIVLPSSFLLTIYPVLQIYTTLLRNTKIVLPS